mgnify:FL=1
MGGGAGGGGTMQVSYNHAIDIPFTGNKWTNSVFAIEKYDFGEHFSLTGGGVMNFRAILSMCKTLTISL